MANFYEEEKFTLKQDWNWSKIIYKSDVGFIKMHTTMHTIIC